MDDPREIVERYFAVVGDLSSTEADLEELLHSDVRIIEHPNAVSPRGSSRNRAEAVSAFG